MRKTGRRPRVNRVEIIAALLGLINVALVARRNLWNYPFGIAMVTLYAGIFYGERLYSDALLQIFFLAAQFYGWWNWSRTKASEGAVVVERLSGNERVAWAGGMIALILLWGTAMARLTDASFPYWDASAAIPSVAAQILQSQRRIESWVLWILVDLLSIGLYLAKGLQPTALLYGVFLGIAVWGLIEWRGAARQAVAA